MDVRIEPRINYVASQTDGKPAGGGFDLAKLAGEIAGGRGDGSDAQRGAVPEGSVVELGDGDVEAVAEFFLEGAYDLATVLERLCVLDGELEGEHGERHEIEGSKREGAITGGIRG